MTLSFFVFFLTLLYLSQPVALPNESKDDPFTSRQLRRLLSSLRRYKALSLDDKYADQAAVDNALNYIYANEEEEEMMSGLKAEDLRPSKVSDVIWDPIFKAKDGKILVKWPGADDYDFFKWKEYQSHFDAGRLSTAQKRTMVTLRKITVYKLLNYVSDKIDPKASPKYELSDRTAKTDMIYRKIGSDTPSSDFDFSFVRWNKPETVVKSLIKYQNKFVQIYHGYTKSVYDMNFYIGCGFIKESLYDTLADGDGRVFGKMKELFMELEWTDKTDASQRHTKYELAKTFDSAAAGEYTKDDKWLAHHIIVQKAIAIELGTMGIGENDFEVELLQYAEIFYYVLWQLQHDVKLWGAVDAGGAEVIAANKKKRDEYRLYMKVLLYFMNYYQDESYISNEALHFMDDPKLAVYDTDRVKIAIMDNFVFITEYYVHAMAGESRTKEQQLYYFWDRASKYIKRIGEMIKALKGKLVAAQTPLAADSPILAVFETIALGTVKPDSDLSAEDAFNWYSLARLWTAEVRGKTIRGNIENSKIINEQGLVNTAAIAAEDRDIAGHIAMGRNVWGEVLRRTGSDIATLWKRNAIYDNQDRGEGAWSKVFKLLRGEVNGLRDGGQQQALKVKLKSMLYNICGQYDFGTDKMKHEQRNALDDGPILKEIVRAYKKMGRKGRKLEITTYEAYSYQYKNPFET